MQVQAIRLYQKEQFIGNCQVAGTINCDKTTNAKQGWLKQGKGYMEFELVFKQPAIGPYITGVFVNEDGNYTLLDGNIADFVAKCNGCCGSSAVITPTYNGVYPDLAQENVLRTVSVQITDNGTNYDNEQGLYKYQKYVWNGWARTGRTGGVTTYTFNTYNSAVPALLGPDNTTPDVMTYTNTTYTSNTPGSLTTGQRYEFVLNVNGNTAGSPTPVVTAITTGTLADLVTALNANASYATFGTFAVAGGTITLVSHKANTATLTINKVTPA